MKRHASSFNVLRIERNISRTYNLKFHIKPFNIQQFPAKIYLQSYSKISGQEKKRDTKRDLASYQSKQLSQEETGSIFQKIEKFEPKVVGLNEDTMSEGGRITQLNGGKDLVGSAMGETQSLRKEQAEIDYKNWSHEELIRRVEQLEKELKEKNSSIPPKTPTETVILVADDSESKLSKKIKRNPSRFDPAKYSTRLIALKLSYLGKNYNGFEHHINNVTPLPTVEEELWAALMKAHLIFPTPKSDGDEKNFDSLNEKQKGLVDVNWEGCEYSKCGRTDKGVSAFGQVIGIRVRSNRPLGKPKAQTPIGLEGDEFDATPKELENRSPSLSETSIPTFLPAGVQQLSLSSPLSDSETDYEEALDFDPINDEIPYPSILNRLLPPEIRILAWCPTPPLDFSARFSCRERQYRYFFTQPAYLPSPLSMNPISSQLRTFSSLAKDDNTIRKKEETIPDGWLDISAMKQAAKYFEGTHDFRNFCKIDGGKQITNFAREIFFADIEEVSSEEVGAGFAFQEGFLPSFLEGNSQSPIDGGVKSIGRETRPSSAKLYTFTLHGSAFLWHQVRHMVATLFLVGQGLESPSLIQTLLDTSLTPSRPLYEMAEDSPLVLWNCVFPKEGDKERKEALEWVYVGDDRTERKWGLGGLMEGLWRGWREREVDARVAGCLMGVVAAQGRNATNPSSSSPTPSSSILPSTTPSNVQTHPKPVSTSTSSSSPAKNLSKANPSQRIFEGGNAGRIVGKYVPVMSKRRLETAEEVNQKYARRKGFGSSAEMKEALSGVRRLGLGASNEDADGNE